MTLEEMRNVDPRNVDRKTLVQRSSVKLTGSGDKNERITELINKLGNPYCYLEGDLVVKISFAGKGRTIEDCMHAYLSGL